MKNLFKKSNRELDLRRVTEILTSGAATGIAIANFTGKKGTIGGIIGAGLSLLISGIILATQENKTEKLS